MGSYEQIINGDAERTSKHWKCLAALWNYSRKLFIMQEASQTNLASEFVKALEENGIVEVYNSYWKCCQLSVGAAI